MKQNLLFNQASALGKRLAMVLTMLLTIGIGTMWGADTWTLVKDVSELAVGDEVVIAASSSNYALGTTQNSNNRAAVSITKSDDNITWTTDVQVLTLEEGKTSGTFAFYTGSGYLYAASSSSNYLRTETTLSANSSWNISITSAGIATIKATGSNTRNWLRYNGSNNPVIFSCYSSGQNDVAIYKKQATVTNTLSSITLSGQTTTYNVGDSFSFDGTCTAKYSDGSTKTVTPTSVSSPDMNNAGTPTVTVSYTEGGITVKATYTITVSAVSSGDGECTWELVTDASTLKAGDRVVIAAKDYSYAISTTQNGNNRGQASVTKNTSNNTITFGDDVQILTLEEGTESGTLAFNTGVGYLYAASSSKNYMCTETTLSDNSSWEITIDSDGVATIIAQGTNTRNELRYNSSNNPPIFSCYSGGQNDVVIYKEVCTGGSTETLVSLHPNGGSGETTTETIEGTTYTVPACSFSRLGYTFANWNTKADGTGTSYDTDATIDLDGTDVNLYAQWTCKTPVFDIKIKDDNPVVFSGESIELTVVGSNIAADATYQWYKKNGENYDELTGETTNKLTIAEATANDAGNYKCVVTNGTCSGENNYTVKMYHIKGLTDNAWTTPFEFEKSGDTEGTFTIELAATTTYYFKLNDGSVWYWNEGTMIHNNCTDWVIEQEGADTQGKANTGITTTASGTYTFTLNYEDPSKPKLSVTYPQKKMVYLNPNDIWNQNAGEVYTVYSWNTNGGTFTEMQIATDCGHSNIYQAEIDASHDKLLFIRWNQVHTSWDESRWNQSIDLTYQTNGQYKIDDWGNNSDIYWKNGAKSSWASHECTYIPNHTVSFDANGHGTAPEDQCITDGEKASQPTAPTATGYTFGGWYKEAGCTNAWDFANDVVTSDITLYAKWTANIHTLTWDVDGGDALTGTYTSGSVAYGTVIVPPATPTRTGYTFNGWSPAFEEGTTMPDYDLTYTAQWKLIPTLSWSAPSCTAALEADNDYPVLTTNPADLKGITYSSSNTSVATIDVNTGEITLVGVGKSTITASFAGNGTYAPAADASYELTVVASNCRWVETEIGDITFGDDVLITVPGTDGYGNPILNMLQDPQASKNPTIETMNVSDLLNGANVDATLIWNIRKRDDNQDNFTIYRNGSTTDRLVFVSSNDIRVGSSTSGSVDSIFTITPEGYLQSIQTLHNMRMSGSSDWRHYTTAGQTLKFYKRECLDPTEVWVEGNLTNVACTPQLPQIIAKDGGSITLTFTAAEGYALPTSVSVEMGSTTLTTSWNRTTGELNINAPTDGFTDNVLVTVEALQVKTVTFSVDSEDTAPTEIQAEENTDITLPTFTTNLTCVKFIGWTDVASGYTHGTDKLYKAGDSYNVTENVTLHAVYAAGGGYVLVTDVANLAVGDKVIIVSAIADGDGKFWALSTTQNNSNRGQEEVQIIDNTIEPSAGVQILTLETGTQTGTHAFNTGDGYLYAASSSNNHLKTQTTNDANGSWTIEIDNAGVATIKAQGTYTHNWLRYNGDSDIFSCYASGQSDVSIYKESITGYTTDPECEEYDITLEVIGHANGSAKINGQTATPTTSQTVTILNTKMATISDVANVAGYDVTVSKRSGNATFTDNGDGTWAVSEPASNVTIQVQYTAKQTYKVQFVTGTGGTGSFTSLDAYKGQTVTIPANYEPFGLCGEFVGWTEGARASGEKPTKLYQPGDPFTLNSNGTSLYAVYSISASCTSEFALGKSGDYEMYAIYSSKVYYVTQKNGSNDYFYANTEADIEANARVKSTFRMQYDATQTAAWNEQDVYAYTIYISNGSTEYGFWHLNPVGDLDFDAIEPYYWKVKSYNGGYDIYGEANGKTYRITCNGSNFNARTSADAVYFTPGGGIEYWTDIDCSDINVDVTFAWNQFESWPVGMPNANSYKGLAKCSEITEFPVALQEGWTFLGWSTKEYNALHADDLDDENNASRAYPDGSDIYKTGGNTLTLGSADITLYPVFTRYEENEPLNLVNGGEFYMYVKPGNTDVYGGVRRFYIADVNLSSGGFQSTEDCNYARPFTFIKEDEGWLIQFVDEGGKTYYLGANAAASDLTKHQTSKTYWDITVGAGNNPANAYRMMAIGQGSEHALLASLSNGLTSATFKYYAIENLINTPSVYFDIFLGSCEDRVFSSDPTSKPSVTITGGGYVTGSKGQTVFVPSAFTITGKNLNDNYNVNIADVGGLLKFYDEAGNVISDFGKPLGGKLAQTTFYVAYTPTADTDGTEIPSIIVTNGTGGSALNQEITGLIHARHLPAEFAIVAKIGGNWYALPDTALHVQTPEGLLVEVDNVDSPTAVTQSFCNATAWSLRGVKNTRYVVNSVLNGDNVLFAETNTEVIDNRKMLYAGEESKVGAYATYTNYTATNPDRYEWQLTTTDNITYTVNSNSTIVSDPLSVNNSRAFGTHGKFVASEEIRLLPIEGPCIAPAVFQVIEWKTNGMIIMYTGAGVSATTQVGTYAASDAQMTEVDHGVYELTTSQDLTACTGLKLAITFTDASSNKTQKVLVIPAIVSGEKGSTSLVASNAVAKVTDVVVLDDAKLTADGTQYTYNDVVVYPGGKLVIDDGNALGMYTLTLRAGSSWGAAEYEHKYPQFLLKGDYSNSSGQINLDYVTTQDYYYPLSVPEQVTIDDIKYPVDIYGNNVKANNNGSFQLKYYDGAQRVDQGSQYGTGWVVVNENTTTTLEPNQGYAIWGIPKKVSVNGATSVRQKYGIHRIPIKKAAGDLATNEKTNAVVQVTAHGINDANVLPNDKGWNYLGNPYLAQLGGMDGDDEKLQMGRLIQEMIDGKWTGGWVYNNEQVRYITITNDCQNFDPLPVAEAQIPAFTTFFIQAAQDGAILLTAPANPESASIAARHYAAQQETAKEITTGIILTGNNQTDRTGLLIADNFTEEYDFNADLSKFENSGINLYTIGKDGKLAFMAINQALAEQPIPLGYGAPADGEYTIAFDEDRYSATDINALYLIDYDRNVTTNLLHTDYSFVTAAGTNNERFALQVAFIPQNATSVEWVDDATIQVAVDGNSLLLNNLPTDAGVQVFDALGRVIYATPNAPTEMQIALPTGYYLVRIADKQHAVVINTIIP